MPISAVTTAPPGTYPDHRRMPGMIGRKKSPWIIAAVLVIGVIAGAILLNGTKTTTSMQEPPHDTPNELATKHLQ